MSAIAFARFLRKFELAVERQHTGRSFASVRYVGDRRTWGRPGEEFIADFLGVVERELRRGTTGLSLFRWRYVQGASVQLIALKLRLSSLEVEALYDQMEDRLGRALLAAGLGDSPPAAMPCAPKVMSLRPPMARAA